MSEEFEAKHPRDAEGQFTHASVGGWASKVAAQLSLTAKRGGESRPPGHAAAVRRAQQLWAVPSGTDRGGQGRERTDAEQDELDQLEQAFEAYRGQLGLTRSRFSGSSKYVDGFKRLYNAYGERIEGRDTREANSVPESLQRGYRRVGDHPDGFGRLGSQRGTQSAHPQAGGLWIDPANPGTRHAPRYLNDLGDRVMGMAPDESRSHRRKTDRQIDKNGTYGRGEGLDGYREVRSTQPRVRVPSGRLGYGMAEAEGGAAFVAHMKRVQPRVRQEAARQPVRRTPRGTQVEGWMGRADEQMRTRGGR